MSSTQFFAVKNSTGRPIMNGTVTHTTQDYGQGTVVIQNLKPGEQTPATQVITGPSSRDYWYLSWSHDGVNHISFCYRNSLGHHENPKLPAVIELVGGFGDEKTGANFITDGSSVDWASIQYNAWA